MNRIEVEEGTTLNLTVLRNYGIHGIISIQWICNGTALNDNIRPFFGSITFQQVFRLNFFF